MQCAASTPCVVDFARKAATGHGAAAVHGRFAADSTLAIAHATGAASHPNNPRRGLVVFAMPRVRVPIIDLFAGPGGLGEGFSSFSPGRQGGFELALSIEKESSAFQTLLLRSAHRRLVGSASYRHYLDYVQGKISGEAFRSIPSVAAALADASEEAHQFELGRTPESTVDRAIRHALGEASEWVLIGGPPCQAYSLAGRSRRANDETFSRDVKHFLYREYLRIIRKFHPTVFVMENVKGLLSSTHSGRSMFQRILDDLSAPGAGVEYRVTSLVAKDQGRGLAPEDYLIEAERYGIPQCRHRVILLGIRTDISLGDIPLLKSTEPLSVAEAIHDLPPIRSRLSRTADSAEKWHDVVRTGAASLSQHVDRPLAAAIKSAASASRLHTESGSSFIAAADLARGQFGPRYFPAPRSRRLAVEEFRAWVTRKELGGVLQHETRAHIAADLARYLYASTFAFKNGYSPRLRHYPDVLLPEHKNAVAADGERAPFQDRFRVQCMNEPGTTVVSHIAKDGHYYIHYDPSQCRSLTVREAARLQTFPDDYFFEGTRTQQYIQVGNAVPPLLANKIAGVVHHILEGCIPARVARAA